MLHQNKDIFRNYSILNGHASTEKKKEKERNKFYERLKRAYERCPKYDIKLVGDMNIKVWKKNIHLRR